MSPSVYALPPQDADADAADTPLRHTLLRYATYALMSLLLIRHTLIFITRYARYATFAYLDDASELVTRCQVVVIRCH